jgi:hypothetical protein
MKFCLFLVFLLIFDKIIYDNRISSQAIKKVSTNNSVGLNPPSVTNQLPSTNSITSQGSQVQPTNSKTNQSKKIFIMRC